MRTTRRSVKSSFSRMLSTATLEGAEASTRSPWAAACRVDPRMLGDLMAEVDDPALRRTVLGLIATPVLIVNAAAPTLFALIVDLWGWDAARGVLLATTAAACSSSSVRTPRRRGCRRRSPATRAAMF